jgi:hypothetical protein
MSTRSLVAAGLLLWLALPACGRADLFNTSSLGIPGRAFTCQVGPITLRKEAANCRILLHGVAVNPRDLGNGDGVTDFLIHGVLKGETLVARKRVVELPRVIQVNDHNNPPRYVIFVDVDRGKWDFYRGVEATPAVLDYLRGLIRVDPQDRQALLRYCFDYLQDPDSVVSADALQEFMSATDAELRRVAAHLPTERLRTWLRDARTDGARLGLYGFLLGNCGTAKDAELLAGLFKEYTHKETGGYLHGVLCGQILLQPREGWAHVLECLRNPKLPFARRYQALRAVRFVHDSRPDLVGRAELLEAVAAVLNDPELADFGVEDLRRWRDWQLTDHVLGLLGRESHTQPVIRRAIIRYALQCPDSRAARLVAAERQRDPQYVEDSEEMLKLEE